MKLCTKCKKLKPKKAFGKDKKQKDGLHIYCKECVNKNHRKWRKDNPRKVKEQDRRQRLARSEQRKQCSVRWRKNNLKKVLRYNYGLMIEDYNRMLKEQGGICAICGETERVHTRLCIDHDHVTGRVRGLVCSRCNVAMGLLDDSSIKAQEMANYLKEH